MTMKNYYDGRTPYEDYPLDFDIECYNCKYKFDCFLDNANYDTTKTHRCLIERLGREEDDLKRCPFCGGEADVDIGNFGGMVCYCKKCFSQGKECETKEEAVKMWNRRVDNAEKISL